MPSGSRTERITALWPGTFGAWKPGTSASGTAATSSPIRPAASPQPEPRTTATRCSATPVARAMVSAAARASAKPGWSPVTGESGEGMLVWSVTSWSLGGVP